jgi:hypothetical protein
MHHLLEAASYSMQVQSQRFWKRAYLFCLPVLLRLKDHSQLEIRSNSLQQMGRSLHAA